MARRLFITTLAAVALLVSGCTAVGAVAVPGDPGSAAGPRSESRPIGRSAVADDGTVPDASASARATARERRLLRGTDTIQLDAEQLALTGPDLLRTRSMRDTDGTIATLTALLGRPKVTQTVVGDGAHCVPASTSYTWGGALRIIDLATTAAAGNGYDVRILAASVRSRSGSTIHLQGPDGVSVGDDIADRVGAAPDTDKESYGSDGDADWQIVLERGWSRAGDGDRTRDGVNGVSAITSGTTVTVLGSPMPVHSSADC
ncbi:hypothetical protein [Curtobacterium sp. Leaf261]|uniref:hypothetical protein n=1 Tax=Curtobacterium sp. Leaf261 TaxID=1736311 RepID=UPI0006F5DF05|nr:hypothetical protein [Curtobacterium sp. Leaf261]KQO59717.1 hypothetical protein ASF23_15590 [Curtobacterium sp. Leaf261]